MYPTDDLLISGDPEQDAKLNCIADPDSFAPDDCLNAFPPVRLLLLTRTEQQTRMSTAEDEPPSGLNGRLRPRKSQACSPLNHMTLRKSESKVPQDKPNRRTSTPSKVSPSNHDDLANKSDISPTTQILCPYCDRKFASKQTVSKHLRRVHFTNAKKDPTECLFCNHTEIDHNIIISHMVDNHPNQYFACLDCHTRFHSTSQLAEHKLNVCEKQKVSFRNKSRQKALTPKKSKKVLNLEANEVFKNDDKNFQTGHDFKGIVISCEFKPSQVHEDIEDNITTNLILPPSKSLGNSTVIEKKAVIVLDDIQWNKRIPSNFSFHNTDADQILSRLGVVHRSHRTGESTKRDWFRALEDSTQKFEKCFDTSFYSKVASNVQENLSKFLDGTFNFNPTQDNIIKTRKSKNSVVINTAEGFPILLACEQYTRNPFDGNVPRAIAPKHKWKWDNLDSDKNINLDQVKRDSHTNNCIITLVSGLDIWTQLRMRLKFENKFNSAPLGRKSEEQTILGNELKEILESREIPSTSQMIPLVKPPMPNHNALDFPASLGLTSSTPKYDLQPAVLSGEWVRPRCYVCCACGTQATDSRALSTHISIEHPNAQVQHYEIVGEPLLNADILKHLYVPPSQLLNRTRPLRGFRECTKCSKSISFDDLHQHMLDCAGDTPTVRRRQCRYRPFGVRRRRTRLPDNMIRKKMRKGIRNRQRRQKALMRPRPRIRTEVGDAETIRKMLADLPAKRHRVMVNPANHNSRPRRKLEEQRNKFIMKKRANDDVSSRRRFATNKEMSSQRHTASTSRDDPNKNMPIKDETDDCRRQMKSKVKTVIRKSPRQTRPVNRKAVINRAKRKSLRVQEKMNMENQDNLVANVDNAEIDELSNNVAPERVDVSKAVFQAREHSNRGGSNNRDGQRPSTSRPNGNVNNPNPAENVPLKHSIARLTANSETHDKSVQFHHLFLVQQECNNTNQIISSGQRLFFENETVVPTLDKPPLKYSQKGLFDLYNLQKNKLNKPRKKLNDCIAMLKNKLVDPVPSDTVAQISVQCGSDEPIDTNINISPNLQPENTFIKRPLTFECGVNTAPESVELCISNLAPESSLSTKSKVDNNQEDKSPPIKQSSEIVGTQKSELTKPSNDYESSELQLKMLPEIEIIPDKNVETTTNSVTHPSQTSNAFEQTHCSSNFPISMNAENDTDSMSDRSYIRHDTAQGFPEVHDTWPRPDELPTDDNSNVISETRSDLVFENYTEHQRQSVVEYNENSNIQVELPRHDDIHLDHEYHNVRASNYPDFSGIPSNITPAHASTNVESMVPAPLDLSGKNFKDQLLYDSCVYDPYETLDLSSRGVNEMAAEEDIIIDDGVVDLRVNTSRPKDQSKSLDLCVKSKADKFCESTIDIVDNDMPTDLSLKSTPGKSLSYYSEQTSEENYVQDLSHHKTRVIQSPKLPDIDKNIVTDLSTNGSLNLPYKTLPPHGFQEINTTITTELKLPPRNENISDNIILQEDTGIQRIQSKERLDKPATALDVIQKDITGYDTVPEPITSNILLDPKPVYDPTLKIPQYKVRTTDAITDSGTTLDAKVSKTLVSTNAISSARTTQEVTYVPWNTEVFTTERSAAMKALSHCTTANVTRNESTTPVYTLGNACISVTKIEPYGVNLKNPLVSIPGTTIASSTAVYTLAGTTKNAPINFVPISNCSADQKNMTSKTLQNVSKPATVDISISHAEAGSGVYPKVVTETKTIEQDPETARKIALLPKELVDILGNMPVDHRNQLLNILPQYVSTSTGISDSQFHFASSNSAMVTEMDVTANKNIGIEKSIQLERQQLEITSVILPSPSLVNTDKSNLHTLPNRDEMSSIRDSIATNDIPMKTDSQNSLTAFPNSVKSTLPLAEVYDNRHERIIDLTEDEHISLQVDVTKAIEDTSRLKLPPQDMSAHVPNVKLSKHKGNNEQTASLRAVRIKTPSERNRENILKTGSDKTQKPTEIIPKDTDDKQGLDSYQSLAIQQAEISSTQHSNKNAATESKFSLENCENTNEKLRRLSTPTDDISNLKDKEQCIEVPVAKAGVVTSSISNRPNSGINVDAESQQTISNKDSQFLDKTMSCSDDNCNRSHSHLTETKSPNSPEIQPDVVDSAVKKASLCDEVPSTKPEDDSDDDISLAVIVKQKQKNKETEEESNIRKVEKLSQSECNLTISKNNKKVTSLSGVNEDNSICNISLEKQQTDKEKHSKKKTTKRARSLSAKTVEGKVISKKKYDCMDILKAGEKCPVDELTEATDPSNTKKSMPQDCLVILSTRNKIVQNESLAVNDPHFSQRRKMNKKKGKGNKNVSDDFNTNSILRYPNEKSNNDRALDAHVLDTKHTEDSIESFISSTCDNMFDNCPKQPDLQVEDNSNTSRKFTRSKKEPEKEQHKNFTEGLLSVDEIGLNSIPLRRSRRGLSLSGRLVEHESTNNESLSDFKPLTKKQLIFSKLLLDEENHTKQLTDNAVDKNAVPVVEEDQCKSKNDLCDLPMNIQKDNLENDIYKSKPSKRKTSPHLKRKSKKKKKLESIPDTSDIPTADEKNTSESFNEVLSESKAKKHKIDMKTTPYSDDNAVKTDSQSSFAKDNDLDEVINEVTLETNVKEAETSNYSKNVCIDEKTNGKQFQRWSTVEIYNDPQDEASQSFKEMQVTSTKEKRKIGNDIDISSTLSTKAKKPKLRETFDGRIPDINEKSVVVKEQTDDTLLISEKRSTTCYNISAATRRTRSKSFVSKSKYTEYDPYDIDLDEMIEKSEPVRKREVMKESHSKRSFNLSIDTVKSIGDINAGITVAEAKSGENKDKNLEQKSANKNAIESLAMKINKSPNKVTEFEERPSKQNLCHEKKDILKITVSDDITDEPEINRNLSDSDESSKSDLPLTKYLDKMKDCVEIYADKLSVETPSEERAKKIKNTETRETKEEVEPNETVKQLRSEQFMESFGFFSERQPRKSNLLATKKISETFHSIANESDDVYFDRKDRTSKTSLQNERRKSIEVGNAQSSKKFTKRGRKKKESIKTTPSFCDICKKVFRRSDNYLRHQMSLLHISKLSEIEMKMKPIPIHEEPNCLIVFKQHLDKLIAKRKKNSKTKMKLPPLDQILVEVNKSVREQQLSKRGLSRDEALFLDCCELLKESHKSDIPCADTSVAKDENNYLKSSGSGVEIIDTENDKDSKSDGDMDSITAQNILESEEVRNLENDLISGLKEAANSNVFQLNRNESIVNEQRDESLETFSSHNAADYRYDQVDDFDDIIDELSVPKVKKHPEIKEKLYPDLDNIDMFEDKFDKIKRKCRSQAAAAKQTQHVAEPSSSFKGRKKKKGKKSSKKNHHSTVLTKGALKGFDGIKVSIPTSDINISTINSSTENPVKKKKKSASKKKKDKRDSESSKKFDESRSKDTQKKVDVYEFMENEDAELFEFRPSTLMERFKSISSKKATNSAKLDTMAEDNEISSDSASDVDDFVYMSDDYVCSDDETENSLASDMGNVKGDTKKINSPLKRKESVEKNAVMDKIFKHNAVRSEKRTTKNKEPIKPRANLDQLFDSLLERSSPEQSSALNKNEIPVKYDTFVELDKPSTSKYDPFESLKSYDSASRTKNMPPKSSDFTDMEEETISSSNKYNTLSKCPTPPENYDFDSQGTQNDNFIDCEPSTSKKHTIMAPKEKKDTKHYVTLSEKLDDSDDDLFPTDEDMPMQIQETEDKSTLRKSEENYDGNIELDVSLLDEDTGVARQRARRKCTVGKQNVLAETWSSESEPDGTPSRSKSAESDVSSGSVRKKKGKKKDGQQTSGRRGNKQVIIKKPNVENRVNSSNRNAPITSLASVSTMITSEVSTSEASTSGTSTSETCTNGASNCEATTKSASTNRAYSSEISNNTASTSGASTSGLSSNNVINCGASTSGFSSSSMINCSAGTSSLSSSRVINSGASTSGLSSRSLINCGASTSGLSSSRAVNCGSSTSSLSSSNVINCGASTSGLSARSSINCGASTSGMSSRSSINCGASTSGLSSRSSINCGASTSGLSSRSLINCGASTSGLSSRSSINCGASTSGFSSRSSVNCGASTSGLSSSSLVNYGASSSRASFSRASTSKASTSGASTSGDTDVDDCNKPSGSGVKKSGTSDETTTSPKGPTPLGPPPNPPPPGLKARTRSVAYYWSSEGDDEQEHLQQHGWIVGDSHKKLVTMLAHAKGRKRPNEDKRHLTD